MYAFISGFNSVSLVYMSVLTTTPLIFVTLRQVLKLRSVTPPTLFFFFQEFFGYSVLLQYHMNLRIVFSISVKRPLIFQERLNLFSRSFGMILKILTISCLPIHECGMTFHLGRSFLNSFSNVLYFSVYKSLHPGLNLFQGT